MNSAGHTHDKQGPVAGWPLQPEEVLHGFFGQELELLWVMDQSGRFLMANPLWCSLTGRSPETLRGCCLAEFLPAEDSAHLDSTLQDIALRGLVHEGFLRVKGGEGKTHCVAWRARGLHGKIFAAGRDVTMERQREAGLRKSTELFSEAQKLAGIGSWELEPRARAVFWTEETRAVYEAPDGYAPTWRDWLETFVEEGRLFFEDAVRKALSEHLPFDVICRAKTLKGRERWLRVCGHPVFDGHNVLRVAGILQDVTAQEEAVRKASELVTLAEAASQAKSDFLANVSHEIRTPMNGVIGILGLLLDTPLNEEQRRYVETARRSGEHLLQLLNDVLDYSKIKAGRMELERMDFELLPLLDDVLAGLAVQIGSKNLELAGWVEPVVPAWVRGDSSRLRQILMNIVGNAIKFTPSGEVLVRVEADPSADDLVRFAVRDTGIGVPAHRQSHLFDKFTQGDTSTSRRFGGTGLGLAICKELCELMGGKIGVVSPVPTWEVTPNLEQPGSEFWFTVRLPPAPHAQAKSQENRLPEDARRHHWIVVDPHGPSARALASRLIYLGLPVVEMDDADTLLAHLDSTETPQRQLLVVLIARSVWQSTPLLWEKLAAMQGAPPIVLLQEPGAPAATNEASPPHVFGVIRKPVHLHDLMALASRLTSHRPDISSFSKNLAPTSRQSPQSAPSCVPLPSMPASPSTASRRVLLAEDNSTNQLVALGLLKKFGVHADAVANGAEAIAALSRVPYDLVLMDVQMPEMDGLEATRRIRQGFGNVLNPNVPIVAMTARALAGDREICLEAGMNDYLSKPVVPAQLASVLRKWLPPVDQPAVEENSPATPGSFGVPKNASAHVPAAPEPKLCDLERARTELAGEQELLLELVEVFLKATPSQLTALKKAAHRQQWKEAAQAAHTLKGSAATLHAESLRDLFLEIERLCRRAQETPPDSHLLEALLREADQRHQTLMTFLQEQRLQLQKSPSQ